MGRSYMQMCNVRASQVSPLRIYLLQDYMRPSPVVAAFFALAALVLCACGTMQTEPGPPAPRAGIWSLEYRGDCSGQEAETLHITRLDDQEIAFSDFQLLRNEADEYVGGATFFAPMPADGRNIPYEISYRLRASDAGGFAGEETIVEGGGHGLDCPIELIFIGED